MGELVRRSLIGEGELVDLVAGDERLGREAAALIAPGVPVTRRTTRGGAGPGPVAEQILRFAARLDADRARLTGA